MCVSKLFPIKLQMTHLKIRLNFKSKITHGYSLEKNRYNMYTPTYSTLQLTQTHKEAFSSTLKIWFDFWYSPTAERATIGLVWTWFIQPLHDNKQRGSCEKTS